MNLQIKKYFLEKWETYFPGCELPLACYFADEMNGAEFSKAPRPNKKGFTCVFSQLAPVRNGHARAFNIENLGCSGSKMYFGFDETGVTDDLRDYLVNVERYKKTYELIDKWHEFSLPPRAPGRYIVFKRWDVLLESDEPQVVFFFVNIDALSGLYALANFDTITPDGVIMPFGAGCDALVGFPMRELESKQPKAVLGGLDPAMRVCMKPHLLTFSTPWPKFLSMLENIDSSILTIDTWEQVKARFTKEQ